MGPWGRHGFKGEEVGRNETGVLSIPTFQVGVFCGKVETLVWSSGASPGRLRFQELQVQRSSEKRGELQGGQVPMPCATEMSEQG